MKVIWSTEAKDSLQEIVRYIRHEFGDKRRSQFVQEVREAEKMISRRPTIGKIDPLFAKRRETYRSVIINGLNKMVYYVKNDTIRIAAFWDCRREPTIQARQAE